MEAVARLGGTRQAVARDPTKLGMKSDLKKLEESDQLGVAVQCWMKGLAKQAAASRATGQTTLLASLGRKIKSGASLCFSESRPTLCLSNY